MVKKKKMPPEGTPGNPVVSKETWKKWEAQAAQYHVIVSGTGTPLDDGSLPPQPDSTNAVWKRAYRPSPWNLARAMVVAESLTVVLNRPDEKPHPGESRTYFLRKCQAERKATELVLLLTEAVCWGGKNSFYVYPGRIGEHLLRFWAQPTTDVLHGQGLSFAGWGAGVQTSLMSVIRELCHWTVYKFEEQMPAVIGETIVAIARQVYWVAHEAQEHVNKALRIGEQRIEWPRTNRIFDKKRERAVADHVKQVMDEMGKTKHGASTFIRPLYRNRDGEPVSVKTLERAFNKYYDKPGDKKLRKK